MFRKARFLIGITVCLFLGFSGCIRYLETIWSSPLLLQETSLLTVADGTSGYQVIAMLKTKEWLPYRQSFAKLWLRIHGKDLSIKKGTYLINPDSRLSDVFIQLDKGKEHHFSVTLVEGETWVNTLERLASNPYIINTFDNNVLDEMLDKWATLNEGIRPASPEGLLLAETYFFTSGTTVTDIVLRASNALYALTESLWRELAVDLPFNNPYQAIVLASIIEKETALDHERALISGVFINRLRKGMRLQTDPTVIYGISDFDGNITKKHLKTPTPYNTYVITGLPPTPIALVGKAALLAAIQPQVTESLYFVSRGDGSHVFSKTLNEHNKAVARYQLATK